jgi:hypothetical protein
MRATEACIGKTHGRGWPAERRAGTAGNSEGSYKTRPQLPLSHAFLLPLLLRPACRRPCSSQSGYVFYCCCFLAYPGFVFLLCKMMLGTVIEFGEEGPESRVHLLFLLVCRVSTGVMSIRGCCVQRVKGGSLLLEGYLSDEVCCWSS